MGLILLITQINSLAEVNAVSWSQIAMLCSVRTNAIVIRLVQFDVRVKKLSAMYRRYDYFLFKVRDSYDVPTNVHVPYLPYARNNFR